MVYLTGYKGADIHGVVCSAVPTTLENGGIEEGTLGARSATSFVSLYRLGALVDIPPTELARIDPPLPLALICRIHPCASVTAAPFF